MRYIYYFPLLTLIMVFTSCLHDENIKTNYKKHDPVQLNDGWAISTPEAEGFDPGQIDQVYKDFFSEDLFPTLRSLIIVRNGSIVAEGYCRNENDRNNYYDIKSATKGITSLLTGIAIDKGLIDSINTPLYTHLSEYFDNNTQKREITLYHALTMQTGLEFDNKNDPDLYYFPGSSLKYALSRNLIADPGTSYYYHDCNPQLVSGLVQAVSGKSLEDFSKENLFGPLEITQYHWEKSADGLNFGAFGLWLIPRDMAKIGQLMLQDGTWNGNQIISNEWVHESTKLQVLEERYGYYWRVYDENNIFQAQGHGGQFILVVREKNLVVILTADPYSKEWILSPGYGKLLDDIFYAVID